MKVRAQRTARQASEGRAVFEQDARTKESCIRVGAVWNGRPDAGIRRVLAGGGGGGGFVLAAETHDAEGASAWPETLDVAVVCLDRFGARAYALLRKLRAALPEGAALVVVSDGIAREIGRAHV